MDLTCFGVKKRSGDSSVIAVPPGSAYIRVGYFTRNSLSQRHFGTMNKAQSAFLRRLRASGRSNMYGAIPYLMNAFSLDRDSAFRVVCEWLDQQAAAERGELPAPAPVVVRPRRRGGRSRAA
jgi:hypothetical protein